MAKVLEFQTKQQRETPKEALKVEPIAPLGLRDLFTDEEIEDLKEDLDMIYGELSETLLPEQD